MIGKTIRRGGLHYEILEQTCLLASLTLSRSGPLGKIGEAHLVPRPCGTAKTSSIHYNGVKL